MIFIPDPIIQNFE